MPEEHAQMPTPPAANQQPAAPAPAAPAATPIPAAMNKADKASSLKFAEHSDFNLTLLILWLVAAFAVLVTVYFWWNERDLESSIADKKAALTAIEGNLSSKANVDTEKQANDFKASVSALSGAYKKRYSYTKFLPELYKKINKDVSVSTISISSEGSVSITGKAKSYRSIADQVVSLQTFTGLKAIDLASTSVIDQKSSQEFSFTIKAELAKTDSAASATAAGGAQ